METISLMLAIILTCSLGLATFYIFLLKKRINTLKNEKDEAFKKVNYAIQEKTELELLLQTIQEAIITTDMLGNITLINKKAQDIFKVDSDFLKGKNVAEILSRENLGGKIILAREVSLKSAQGDDLTVKISSFPLVIEGDIMGNIYIIHDLTQQVNKEQELEELKLNFVTMAAHQLRTPLTIVKSYLSVLTQQMSAKLDPEERDLLSKSEVGVNRLSALIENLLNVSKIEGGKLHLNREFVSLEDLIERTIKNLDANATQKEIKLLLNKPTKPLPKVFIDSYLIGEVIKNLIINAIDFSLPKRPVEISAQLVEGFIIVYIKDYGKGIPSKGQDHLFTKFFKVTSELIQGSKGTGIGLYISKNIIEAHGGKIWVNSVEGLGATFSFSLPTSSSTLPPQYL